MTDQPRKPLSLKSKSAYNTITGTGSGEIRRSRKRIIKRDQLPASKLATTKKPPPKSKKKPKTVAPKNTGPSPSSIRAANLNTALQDYSEVWREFKPLAIGVDKEIYRFISQRHLSASKRVVQRLLKQHVKSAQYQENIRAGHPRCHLDGS